MRVRQLTGFARKIEVWSELTPSAVAKKFTGIIDSRAPSFLANESAFKYFDREVHHRGPELVRKLLLLDGVKSVLMGVDFLTVTREEARDWLDLEPFVLSEIRSALEGGEVLYSFINVQSVSERDIKSSYNTENSSTVNTIKQILEEYVAPNVRADGGEVVFVEYKRDDPPSSLGIVRLALVGACASCPSSTVTVRFQIKNLLIHYMPDHVRDVERVGDEELRSRGLLGLLFANRGEEACGSGNGVYDDDPFLLRGSVDPQKNA